MVVDRLWIPPLPLKLFYYALCPVPMPVTVVFVVLRVDDVEPPLRCASLDANWLDTKLYWFLWPAAPVYLFDNALSGLP